MGIYDYVKEEFGWIDSSKINENILGINGISTHYDKYYVVAQLRSGGISGLSVLNKNDLEFVKNYELQETSDGHSLIAYDNGFLITDTGKNRLVKIKITNENKINETEFW